MTVKIRYRVGLHNPTNPALRTWLPALAGAEFVGRKFRPGERRPVKIIRVRR